MNLSRAVGNCDDAGMWKRLEAYFESHTAVELTHGICPDCSEKFFKPVMPP